VSNRIDPYIVFWGPKVKVEVTPSLASTLCESESDPFVSSRAVVVQR